MKKNKAGKAVVEFPHTKRDLVELLELCTERPEAFLEKYYSHLIPEMPADMLAALRAGDRQYWTALIAFQEVWITMQSVRENLEGFAAEMGTEPRALFKFTDLFIEITNPKNNRRTWAEDMHILAKAARVAADVSIHAAYQFEKDEPDDPELVMPVSRKTLERLIEKYPETWKKLRKEV